MTEAQVKELLKGNDPMSKADAIARLVAERDYLALNKSSIRTDGATITTCYGDDGKSGRLKVYGDFQKALDASIALSIEIEIDRIKKMILLLMGGTPNE